MLQEEIYADAIAAIQQRRRDAQIRQEQRTLRIRQEIPGAAALSSTLSDTCFSVLRAAGSADRAQKLAAIRQRAQETERALAELLTAHGYPADYLKVQYSCKKCDDTGFVGGKPCECLRHEIGRAGAARLNARSQLALCSFDTFSLSYYKDLPANERSSMERNFADCKRYAADFSVQSGNLLMIGKTGLGKTHLSLAIANVLLEKGFSVIYDSAGSLMHRLQAEQFNQERFAQSRTDTLPLLLECDLLIIDDFGTEFSTKFTNSIFYTLLNGRISAGLPFIVSTNLDPKDIQQRYGDRVLSRLICGAQLMPFFGRDIRMLRASANSQDRRKST